MSQNPIDLDNAKTRLDKGLYTPDWKGIQLIYDDCCDLLIGASLAGSDTEARQKTESLAARELAALAGKIHNSKEARTRLLIDVISRCCEDYMAGSAIKHGPSTKPPLDRNFHVWPFCSPEYPRLSTIRDHWANAIQIVCRVDEKAAQARRTDEGRTRIHEMAEAARLEDKRKVEEIQSSDRDLDRARVLDRLEAFDRAHPDLGRRIREYLAAYYPGSKAFQGPRAIVVHFERALGPESWAVPTAAEARQKLREIPTSRIAKRVSVQPGTEESVPEAEPAGATQ